jgi:hypothetical protein
MSAAARASRAGFRARVLLGALALAAIISAVTDALFAWSHYQVTVPRCADLGTGTWPRGSCSASLVTFCAEADAWIFGVVLALALAGSLAARAQERKPS